MTKKGLVSRESPLVSTKVGVLLVLLVSLASILILVSSLTATKGAKGSDVMVVEPSGTTSRPPSFCSPNTSGTVSAFAFYDKNDNGRYDCCKTPDCTTGCEPAVANAQFSLYEEAGGSKSYAITDSRGMVAFKPKCKSSSVVLNDYAVNDLKPAGLLDPTGVVKCGMNIYEPGCAFVFSGASVVMHAPYGKK